MASTARGFQQVKARRLAASNASCERSSVHAYRDAKGCSMRLVGLITALVLALSAPASATGTVRIQQNDGSVKTYTGVIMKVANKTLTLTSADRVSTVAVSGADCAPDSSLIRCTGGGFTLLQDGQKHVVPFKTATFYFNATDQEQQLPLSTTKIGAHSVIFSVQTAKGTYITGNGKLDKGPTQ
jgi:hypothetical protein